MAGAAIVAVALCVVTACGSAATVSGTTGHRPHSSYSLYECTSLTQEGGPSDLPTTTTECSNSRHPQPITLGPSVSVPPPSYVPRPKLGHYPYAWADSDWDDPIADAATFTLVHGISPKAALRILVPKQKRKTPFESPALAQKWINTQPTTDDYAEDPQLVEAGERQGWTMILEINDYRATDLATLHRLSRAGAAVVIYNNVEDLASFQYAVRGRLRREFDPFGGPGDNDAPTRGTPLPQEAGLRFTNTDRYISQSLRLAARLTGFRIVKADLAQKRYTVGVAATH